MDILNAIRKLQTSVVNFKSKIIKPRLSNETNLCNVGSVAEQRRLIGFFTDEQLRQHSMIIGTTRAGMSETYTHDKKAAKIKRKKIKLNKQYLKGNPHWNKVFNIFFGNNHSCELKIFEEEKECYINKVRDNLKTIKGIDPILIISEWRSGISVPVLWNVFKKNVDKLILDAQRKKIISAHFSEKYKFLISLEVETCLNKIIEFNIDEELFYNFIIKKIARFKSPDDLEEALIHFINRENSWSIDAYIEKFEKDGLRYFKKDNELFLFIDSYKVSQKYSPQSWCVQYCYRAYNNTLKREGSMLVAKFDFNAIYRTNVSIIGITLNLDGDIYFCHDMFDGKIYIEKETSDDLSIPAILEHIKVN